ncbi:MAG: TIGR00282 family metallophosphoesterase [Planctomycetota bacterium]|nr:MAG: TIGR00282 family metallophosphoesterase [Planctomycetota bacterium]
MQVNLLCIGDVVGKPGRFVLSQVLPDLIRKYDLDCVICNAENAAGGSGLTGQLYKKFLHYGVNLITLGDHAYRKLDIIPVIEQSDHIVRPANFPPTSPGKTFAIYQTNIGPKVAVVSLLGRLYMRPTSDCPYRAIDNVLHQIPDEVKIIVVDIHAEATSEKIAMGWYLDGRASVVFGTHTHVSTADECILPQGTAYITDVGMTGPYDSVLGRKKDRVIRTLTTNIPSPFEVANDDPRLCGILVQVESTTGNATHIERIRVDVDNTDKIEPT